MPTFSMKLTFKPKSDVNEILQKVRCMEQEAVRWMISNNKTALKTVHADKYLKFRNRYPELHSQVVLPEQGIVGYPRLPVLWRHGGEVCGEPSRRELCGCKSNCVSPTGSLLSHLKEGESQCC